MSDPASPPRARDPEGDRRLVTLAWLGGFLLALLVLVQALDWSGSTRRLDRLLHDAWTRVDQRAPPDDVIIAAIDERSLAELGRWPWSRDLQSVVVAELGRLGARAVLVDVIYAEPSDDRGADARLAEAFGSVRVPVLPVLLETGRGARAQDLLPIPVIARAAGALGHVSLPIDDDGIVRRAWLKAGVEAAHWPSLALAAHEALGSVVAMDPPGRRPARPAPGRRGAGGTAALAGDHEVMIPFYGPAGTFGRVSVASLVKGLVPRARIAGRTVLLGLTADGLGDSVPSPVSALDRPLSGVEAHATLYAALGDGSLVVAAPRWTGIALALGLLPLLLLAYSRAPPGLGLLVALTGAVVPVVVSAAMHAVHDLWYPPVAASLAALASWLFWSRHRLSFVNRFLERERVRLDRRLPEREGDGDERLASFFEQASRHLGLTGWRLRAGKRRFAGGRHVPAHPFDKAATGWHERRGVWSRRYRVPGGLEIGLRFADDALGPAFTRYVDSLGRVRSRQRPGRLSGTVERLQGNALRVSGQLERLSNIKRFSETLMAGAPIGLAIWTPAGEAVRINPMAGRLVPGLGPTTVLIDFLVALGQDIDNDADARTRLDSLLLRGVPWQIVRDRAEQEIVVELSAVGATLERRLVCATLTDVSEIRSAERARAEMVDYLSHDLRSPLISALYLVEGEGRCADRAAAPGAAAAPDAPDGSSAPDGAEGPSPATPSHGVPVGGDRRRDDDNRRVAANIRRSLSMMDDLLHVARADALEPSAFVEVLLDAVVDNALDQLAPQARGRGIRLVPEGDGELWVLGDASSLERAVVNIVGNAIKYSHDGGTVRIGLARESDDGEGDDGGDGEGDGPGGGPGRARLTITDEGVGIDPDAIDGLFKRFRRDPRVLDSHQGIGLGLALVSRVVSQHGGDVAASSAGGGTEISVRLPLLDDGRGG